MQFHPARPRCTLLLALFLFLELSIGCQGKREGDPNVRCRDVVTVNHQFEKGVDHKAVYLCDQHQLQFKKTGNVSKFEVEFIDPPDGPFGPDHTKFGTEAGESDT